MTGARGPDGKTVYLAGRHSTANGLDLWKKGRVHAVDLTAPLTPVSGFNGSAVGLLQMRTLADVDIPAGTPLREQPWSDWGAKMGMAAVHGLDVDPQGNVYACDRATTVSPSTTRPASRWAGSPSKSPTRSPYTPKPAPSTC